MISRNAIVNLRLLASRRKLKGGSAKPMSESALRTSASTSCVTKLRSSSLSLPILSSSKCWIPALNASSAS